ncbi:MAG: adenosylcobinamide-phosphate synthase CbiB, partial [Thermodesulfobacteriota bacterium]
MLFLTVFESQILIALALDAIIGDPRYRFHPVRIIGWFCSRCENFFRTLVKNVSLAGILTFSAVIVFTLALTGYILVFAAVISPVVLTLCGILLLYTTIGAGDLFNHSRAVYDALKKSDDPSPARAAVSMIVGRDTGSLDRPALIRATVETVAENMVDGITAPLFYAVLFSPVALLLDVNPIVPAVLAAMTYKAVNTMDSMFGYKNDRYLQFGRCAAKVDDAANFIPARLSGFCLVGAAWLLSMDYRSGWRLLQRDRLKHASPNGGHPEAA